MRSQWRSITQYLYKLNYLGGKFMMKKTVYYTIKIKFKSYKEPRNAASFWFDAQGGRRNNIEEAQELLKKYQTKNTFNYPLFIEKVTIIREKI